MRTTVAVILLAAGAAVGQQPAARPAGLDAVPADGFAFISVNVAKVWDTEELKGLRDALLKIEGAGAQAFAKQFGVPLGDLDRVTFLWPTFPDSYRSEEPVAVASTRKPIDRAKVLRALGAETFAEAEKRKWQKQPVPAFPGGGIKKSYESKEFAPPPPPIKKGPELVVFRGQPRGDDRRDADDPQSDVFVLSRMRMTLVLLDDSTAVFLPDAARDPQQVIGFLAKTLRRKADGPLAEALAVAGKHAAVAGVDFRPLRREMDREERFPRDLLPFRPVTRMDGGFATLDVGGKTTVTAALRFPTAEEAGKAEPALKTAIQLAAEELGGFKKRIAANEPQAAFAGPILDAVLAALDKAAVKADGKAVVATATAEVGPAVEKALKALPAYLKYQNEELRTQNNLKQIALALWNYHDSMGHFPQDVVDRAGKPILSWRVQILPYLEQATVARQVDFTKPWDDPANAKVLATVPDVFKAFGRDAKDGETYFQMFTAPKAVPGGSPLLIPGQRRTVTGITDGTSNTFGVVEATEGVNWAKPGDLPFDPKKLPALGDPKTDKFRVTMLDGSVRTMRRDKLTDAQLRAFITVDGGEIVEYNDR